MNPKSAVYTRGGDRGTTSLVGGTRVSKDSPRLEAYGAIDEANAHIGLLHSSTALPQVAYDTLKDAMNRLFDIGCILATEADSKWQPAPFPAAAVEQLEADIDALDATLPRHNRFVLPSGHPMSAQANVARTVLRRAERRIISLAAELPVDATLMKYVNRLSDYLFVLGRAINHCNGIEEVYWG